MTKFKQIYDNRWQLSKGTSDEDVMVIGRPKTQIEFFFLNYNQFISKKIIDFLNNGKGKKLLELGCGRATASIYQALKLELEIFPSDYSQEALKIAKNNLAKYGLKKRLVQANLYDMPYSDNSFDVIISVGVMEHLEEPQRAYGEILRLLRKDGVMISMNVPDKPDNIQKIAAPINRFLLKLSNILNLKDSKPWLDNFSRSITSNVYRSNLTAQGFKRIVEESGFSNVSFYQINPFPTFDPVPEIINFIIVKIYESILKIRKIFLRINEPFLCTEKISRAHFIVAQKQ